MNEPIRSDRARSIQFVWLSAILLLAVGTLAAFWYPMQRIPQYADINYNEGWNTYRADMAARGEPLYGLPPRFMVTNYPLLSFHFLGFLGKFMGGFVPAGRWIALASLVFVAVTVAALVQHYTGRWRISIYAALLFGMALAVFMPDRVGMNDPQLLGLAWSVVGLWLYARNPRSNWLLCASALAFGISLFTKQNLLSFPAAVGLHLLLKRAWRPLAVWSAALAVTAGSLLLLTFRWDGPYFFLHLLAPRTYSFLGGWNNISPYLLEFQVIFAAAVLWSAYYATWPLRNLLAIAFVLAHIFGFAFAGGDGVVGNVLFEGLVMLAAITAIGIGDLESKLITLRFGHGLLLLALTMPYLGSLALLPGLVLSERRENKLRPNLDAEFRRAVEFLQNRPGPALCEDLLLCYDAGKPPLYDAFYATSQAKVGRLSEADVVNYIQSSRFPTIAITLPAEQPLAPVSIHRFSEPVLHAILERYRLAFRTSELALLVPKEEPEVSGNFR